MELFHRFSCALGFHEPKRRHVEWEGFNYVGKCRHCRAELRRTGKRRWRRDKGLPRNANLVRHLDHD